MGQEAREILQQLASHFDSNTNNDQANMADSTIEPELDTHQCEATEYDDEFTCALRDIVGTE